MLLTRKLPLVASMMISCLVAGPALAATAETAAGNNGVTDKEVVLSSLSMTSGPVGDYGRLSNVGIDAYFNQLNDAGGVLGRKLRCLHPDDKYNKDNAIANFDNLMKEGVFGFVSLTGSAQVAGYLPRVDHLKLPAVGGFSAPQFSCEPPKPTYYQTRMSFLEEQEQQIDKLWNDGYRRFGIVYQFDAYGRDFIEGAKQALAKHGAKLAVSSTYDKTNPNFDFKNTINELKAANPPLDVVLLGGITWRTTAKIMQQARAMNYNPPVVFANSAFCPGVHDLGANVDGEPMSITVPLYVKPEPPAVANFKKAMAKYFPGEKPNAWSFKGYIDAMVMAEAIKRAGKDLTREKVNAALAGMKNVDIGLGKDMLLTYTPQDHWGYHKLFWVTTKNGSVVPFEDWAGMKKRTK